MERSHLSNTESDAVRDIDTLRSYIVSVLGAEDPTILPQAHALASYMVIVKKLPVDVCANRLFANPIRTRRIITRLLASQTTFMNLEPRALGVDLVSYTTAAKMQQSLDVKQYRKKVKIDDDELDDGESGSTSVNYGYACLSRKTPNIKPNHLFADKEYAWLRWYGRHVDQTRCTRPRFIVEYLKFAKVLKINVNHTVEAYKIVALNKTASLAVTQQYKHFDGTDVETDTDNFYDASNIYTFLNRGGGRFVCTRNQATMDNLRFQKSNDVVFIVLAYHRLSVFQLVSGLYESYVAKSGNRRSDTVKISAMLDVYNSDPDCSLIFLSELSFFRYNVLLFISNYVKFMYCYGNNRNTFDPSTFDDCRMTEVYMSNACLFLSTTNLSSMSEDTHGPLVAYTAERPKILMSKLAKTKKTFVNEGVRAMQSVNLASDVGVRSNIIEVSGVLKPKIDVPIPYEYYDFSIIE